MAKKFSLSAYVKEQKAKGRPIDSIIKSLKSMKVKTKSLERLAKWVYKNADGKGKKVQAKTPSKKTPVKLTQKKKSSTVKKSTSEKKEKVEVKSKPKEKPEKKDVVKKDEVDIDEEF